MIFCSSQLLMCSPIGFCTLHIIDALSPSLLWPIPSLSWKTMNTADSCTKYIYRTQRCVQVIHPGKESAALYLYAEDRSPPARWGPKSVCTVPLLRYWHTVPYIMYCIDILSYCSITTSQIVIDKPTSQTSLANLQSLTNHPPSASREFVTLSAPAGMRGGSLKRIYIPWILGLHLTDFIFFINDVKSWRSCVCSTRTDFVTILYKHSDVTWTCYAVMTKSVLLASLQDDATSSTIFWARGSGVVVFFFFY